MKREGVVRESQNTGLFGGAIVLANSNPTAPVTSVLAVRSGGLKPKTDVLSPHLRSVP